MKPSQAVLMILFCSWLPGAMAATVTLPIEVLGENGATSSVTVQVPARSAREVKTVWMQIHNLSYPDIASVQINNSQWFTLNNDTVAVAEPGKSYGGIGGGFNTLKVTLALPAGAVVERENTVRFRFNRTNGVASGFRVLALNFLTSDATKVLNADAFSEEDPSTWIAPLRDADSIRTGKQLWESAPLRASALTDAPQIRAHCADCHAYDGRDLKYFSFSNRSIIARSRFHGLSDIQGQQIASYIRSLPYASPGRPWNPPYQPGPHLDAQPIANWAAGAGLTWVLDDDSATLPYLFAQNEKVPAASALLSAITKNSFRPDGNLNPREIPIALQLPDWNHWLPRVHPLDAWGQAFDNSELSDLYGSTESATRANRKTSRRKDSLRSVLASPEISAFISSGRIVSSFRKVAECAPCISQTVRRARSCVMDAGPGTKAYATELWQLVKTWEMTQEFGLEALGRELFGANGEPRTWFNTIPAATAPSAANIPDGPSGMGGSALTNEYFNACWYELQVLLNSGNHRHRDTQPLDWIYVIGGFQDLYQQSQRPEPARLLVAVIKAMQSTDPRIGPQDLAQGWRPNQNVDPTVMVNESWTPMFEPLAPNVKRAITESFLAAWLDKNMQYPVGRYFRVGLSENSYAPPASYGSIAGGKAWASAALFTAAGVNPDVVKQLQKWGQAYSDVATRFQYSPKSSSRPAPARKSRD